MNSQEEDPCCHRQRLIGQTKPIFKFSINDEIEGERLHQESSEGIAMRQNVGLSCMQTSHIC